MCGPHTVGYGLFGTWLELASPQTALHTPYVDKPTALPHLESHDEALPLHICKAEVDIAWVAVVRDIQGAVQHHSLQLAHDAITQTLLKPARHSPSPVQHTVLQ